MVTTRIKLVTKFGNLKNSLNTEETIKICKKILNKGCFVHVFGGQNEESYTGYRKSPNEDAEKYLYNIERQLEKMLKQGMISIRYDGRGATIKEGIFETKERDDGMPNWMTR